MNFDVKTLVPWFDALSSAAETVKALVPEQAKPVAAAIEAALRFASELAKQGVDPVVRIERLHAADVDLQNVENAWAQELRDKFGSNP